MIVDRIHTDITHARTCGPSTPVPSRAADSVTEFDAARVGGAFSSRPGVSSSGRTALRIAWFGTSLVEHFEAFSARLVDQADLPLVGSTVTVDQWRRRGYVHAVTVWASTRFPDIEFTVGNYGQGGATSSDVLAAVHATINDQPRADLAVLGCGINDVCSLAKFTCCSSDARRRVVAARSGWPGRDPGNSSGPADSLHAGV